MRPHKSFPARLSAMGLKIRLAPFASIIPLTLISLAGPIATPYATGQIVDGLLHGVPLKHQYLLLTITIATLLLSAAAGFFSTRQCISYGHDLSHQMSVSLYSAILRMPLLSYFTMNAGVVVSRLTNDIKMVEPLFSEVPLIAIRSILMILFIATLLLWNGYLYFLVFLVIPLSFILVKFAEKHINHLISRSLDHTPKVAALVESSTNPHAIMLIRQSGETLKKIEAYARANGEIAEIASSLDFWREMVRFSYSFSFSFFSLMILGASVYAVSSGYSTVGAGVAALLYLGMARQPVSELIGLRYPLIRAGMGLSRLEDVYFSPNAGLSSIVSKGNPVWRAVSNPALPTLEFRGVHYRYPTQSEIGVEGLSFIDAALPGVGVTQNYGLTRVQKPPEHAQEKASTSKTLHGISFVVPDRTIIAIGGKSGSGKSTIASLASGFIRPNAGDIFLNGISIRNQNEEDIQQGISYVSQDVYFYNSSVRDNLRCLRDIATDEEVVRACELAGLAELVASLPDGLDTVVGNNGSRFSGGERQRFSLARALVKKPRLLILDEFTSHLDAKREKELLERVQQISLSCAVLMITHSQRAFQIADRIYMIEKGAIVEEGTHQELRSKGSIYSDVYQSSGAHVGRHHR